MSSSHSKVVSWFNPPATIRAVLCHVRRGDELLLIRKARGRFGEGLWNAPGGKIEPGESPRDAAHREVEEETGLKIEDLRDAGWLNFFFGDEKKRADWTVQVFEAASFSGKLRESLEGNLKWFKTSEIPYDEMWADDEQWIPLLISKTRFKGSFVFTSDSKNLLSSKVSKLK